MTKYEEMEIYVGVSKGLVAFVSGAITREECRQFVRKFMDNGSDSEIDEIIDGGIKIACAQAKQAVHQEHPTNAE